MTAGGFFSSKISRSLRQSMPAWFKAPRSTASPLARRTVATFFPLRSAMRFTFGAFSAVVMSAVFP
jgi:hypothetical protein